MYVLFTYFGRVQGPKPGVGLQPAVPEGSHWPFAPLFNSRIFLTEPTPGPVFRRLSPQSCSPIPEGVLESEPLRRQNHMVAGRHPEPARHLSEKAGNSGPQMQ